jgi:nucleoside-diphosphate-sugar epimerase
MPATGQRALQEPEPVVVGSGWLGRAIARSLNVQPLPRRAFSSDDIPRHAAVVVASGRSWMPAGEDEGQFRSGELAHLRQVLDACDKQEARRVVVLGSSDVSGLAEQIRGTTPLNPRTPYARAKADLEEECVGHRRNDLDITTVRLAPAHGPGKQRTSALLRAARWPATPLPNCGRHSVGFIHVADAVKAVRWLLEHPAPPVVAVGAGHTPLRDLMEQLARAQGRRFRCLLMPMPAGLAALVAKRAMSPRAEWALRLALPRTVGMDLPITPIPLDEAARLLVETC